MMAAALNIPHSAKHQNSLGTPFHFNSLIGYKSPQMVRIISMTLLLNISVNTGKTLRDIYNGPPTTLVDIDSIYKFQTYMDNIVDRYIKSSRITKEKQD